MKNWLVTVSGPQLEMVDHYLMCLNDEEDPLKRLEGDWLYGVAIPELWSKYSHLLDKLANDLVDYGYEEDIAWDILYDEFEDKCAVEVKELQKIEFYDTETESDGKDLP